MRNKIRRFYKVYCETFRQSRLLTQFFVFPMAIIIFVRFFDLLFFINNYEQEISPELRANVSTVLIGLAVTGTLFASRFLLLFSRRESLFWISQLVWLGTLFAIYWQLPPSGSNVCVEFWLPGYGLFATFYLLAYLLFSPLRQVLTLIISIGRAFTILENAK